jgi:hypothetical protein
LQLDTISEKKEDMVEAIGQSACVQDVKLMVDGFKRGQTFTHDDLQCPEREKQPPQLRRLKDKPNAQWHKLHEETRRGPTSQPSGCFVNTSPYLSIGGVDY